MIDKIKMFKEEITKINEEIEKLKSIKQCLFGYISVEEVRKLIDKVRGGENDN